MATTPRPRTATTVTAFSARQDELERRLALLVERERILRDRLLDARDALLRTRIVPAPPRPAAASPPPVAAAASPPRRMSAADYEALRGRLRAALAPVLPRDGRVLLVSRGDPQLLELAAGNGVHFPDDGYGEYAGHHPADSAAAIRQLERQRRRGAGFLVFPASERWWLEHYQAFAAHLEGRYRRILEDPAAGIVYDLREPQQPRPRERSRSGSAPRRAPDRRPLAAATIISRNYLSQARVLARSFMEQEPDSRFYLLIVDPLPEGVEIGVPVTAIDPRELEIPSFYEMCFKYGVVELATAVKPFLLSHIMNEYDEEEVVFFDPDILILRPLEELRQALVEGEIVLTPHITEPLPLDGKRPSEQDIMISGAYNLGFIALRRSPQTQRFLAWWEERLQDGCRIDVPHGLFTDQKWIDLVPSLFPATVILRDPTYNCAFWNLHERSVSLEDGRFCVNGRPATFFHISGFDPSHPDRLSKHQSRIEVDPGSALQALLERYGALLREAGHEQASGWSYGYERFANGLRVHPLLRQIYLNLSPGERRRFGDPFVTDSPTSFLSWATRPGDGGRLSRFLDTIYKVRYDLPLHFPDVRGRDRAAFLRWARRWGAAEMGFEPELVHDETPAPVAKGAPPAARAAATKGAPRKGHDLPGGPDATRPAQPKTTPKTPPPPAPGSVPPKPDATRKPPAAAVTARGPVPPGPRAVSAPPPSAAGAAKPKPAPVAKSGAAPPASRPAPRPRATGYETLVERVRDTARGLLPAGSRVLVISRGDYRLVDLGGCEGWHFPQTEEGVYGGYHPSDSALAIAHLEALRDKGAGYLLIPQTALWWLEYYDDFRRHLEGRYRLVVRDHESCLIYSLREQAGARRSSPTRPRWWSFWPRRRAAHAATATPRIES